MSTVGGDLLGFGNADNAVTSRPARAIVRGDTDTWAKDCSSPDADDGTAWPADVFNDMLAQLRTALRSSSISLNGNDDMLWRAMRSVGIRYAVDSGAAGALVVANAVPVASNFAGLVLLVKLANDIPGATTIVVDGQDPVDVKWPDATALAAGDGKAGGLFLIAFDGAKFQLLCRVNGASAAASAFVPGCIYQWPLETPPTGTLECDGSPVSRSTYARLYGIIGTAYGAGNGTTTFNLPNYSGQFLRGWAHGQSTDPDKATRTNRGDGTTGDHVGTRQASANKTHSHSGTADASGLRTYPGYTGPTFGVDNFFDGSGKTNGGGSLSLSIAADGAADARPTNVNILFVIAY